MRWIPVTITPACLAALPVACSLLSESTLKVKESYIERELANPRDTSTIVLRNDFIRACAGRVMIEATFSIDRVDRFVHPAVLDADFHMAGTTLQFAMTKDEENRGGSTSTIPPDWVIYRPEAPPFQRLRLCVYLAKLPDLSATCPEEGDGSGAKKNSCIVDQPRADK